MDSKGLGASFYSFTSSKARGSFSPLSFPRPSLSSFLSLLGNEVYLLVKETAAAGT